MIGALFGGSVGLGGILLVFVGFVYSHAETIDLADQRAKFRRVAQVGLIPFLLSLIDSALCLRWMRVQSPCLIGWSAGLFYICLLLTGLYGIGAFWFYL